MKKSDLKRKVYIWADADEVIGYGHFIRSLALVSMIKEKFDCYFFTKDPTLFQRESVAAHCKLIKLPSGNDRFDYFFNMITGDEIVILDNYFFTSQYQKRLKTTGCRLICIGTNDKHYYADAVINYILQQDSLSAEPYTKFCLGFEWVLLREPFFNAKKTRKSTHQIKSVAICFGGTDQFCLAEKTIRTLKAVSKDFNYHVISTDVIGKLRIKKLRDQDVKVHINISAQEIIDVFSECDVAVLSASSIALEASACEIPIVSGYYIDNQKGIYEKLLEANYIIGINDMCSENFANSLLTAFNNLMSNKIKMNLFNPKNVRNNYIQLLSTL
ncbi:hypothetical protein LJC72_08515 [Bacteroides sp. OttesenSCG-928-D19]|nr:hypothetical protein [Bacteroides sp. OttesenSCG-928-D19]